MKYSTNIIYLSFLNLIQSNELVLYWGQNSAGNEQSLGSYCQNNQANIINISFMNVFDGVKEPQINLSSHCSGATCPQIEKDIQLCQSKGVKVLLSLGGAEGSYGLSSTNCAKNFANQVYQGFLSNGSNKKFGSAILDGIDLDLENKRPDNFDVFVRELKRLKPGVMITAAPQCPFPDASLNVALSSSLVDKVFVQFYNNPSCDLNNGFNFNTWSQWASKANSKVYIGVPASSKGAGSGFVDSQKLIASVNKVRNDPMFGGVMMWDASLAYSPEGLGTSIISFLKSGSSGFLTNTTTNSYPSYNTNYSSTDHNNVPNYTTSGNAYNTNNLENNQNNPDVVPSPPTSSVPQQHWQPTSTIDWSNTNIVHYPSWTPWKPDPNVSTNYPAWTSDPSLTTNYPDWNNQFWNSNAQITSTANSGYPAVTPTAKRDYRWHN